VKPFPIELVPITNQDRDKFEFALEIDSRKQSSTYQSEFLVAKSVQVPSNDPGEEFKIVDLNSLVVDHLRLLCKNIGITNFGSKNKFECRKMLADFLDYQKRLDAYGLHPASNAAKIQAVYKFVNLVQTQS
jgi:hypothetical protein